MPRISLATVYRNLEILSEAGLIAKLEVSGRQKRFDSDISEHDHIFCVQCQRVDNFTLAREQLGLDSLGSMNGYMVTGYRLEFAGLCKKCKNKKVKKKETE